MPKIMKKYRTNGRRQLGRPMKILLGKVSSGTLQYNLWWMMMVVMNYMLA